MRTVCTWAVLALECLLLSTPAPAQTIERPSPATAPPRLPNIVLIVADDLGYAETGVQGGKDIPTPAIDSLAVSGTRFTNAYVTCPVCAPTRAGLATGRYGPRFGFEHNPGPQAQASKTFGLPRDQKTLAEKLKSAGYATGMFGKWHLGFAPELTPPQRGFDEFYGFLGGAHAYLPAARAAARNSGIFNMDQAVEAPEYLTDELAARAAEFIRTHKDEPFFVYLPFNAVHAPLQAADMYLKRFERISDPKRRTFAAMLSSMDDGIGKVLDALRDNGLEECTLVMFISDNGGPTPQTTSGNTPLRGYKGQVWEGGIRVPCMIQWKGQLPAGKVCDWPVISLDLHVTALAAAGVQPEADLDGRNLLPFISEDRKDRPHEFLCWRFGSQNAVRAGEWKLVTVQGSTPQLFNLANDIGESRDLANTNPEKVKELRGIYDTWNARNMPSKWGGKRQKRKPLPQRQPQRDAEEKKS